MPIHRAKQSHEEDGDFFARDWEVTGTAYITPGLIVAGMIVVWALKLPLRLPNSWTLSWAQLARGNMVPLGGYMFAHISALHLTLNAIALMALGGPLIACLGRQLIAWARFFYLFLGSGLAAGIAFVIAHPDNTPVIGASGAIFGVLGALARVHPATGTVVSIRSRRAWKLIKLFLGNHAVLFGIAAIAAILTGQSQSFAWEAHLGGLLFGFLAAPVFLKRTSVGDPPAPNEPD